MLDCDWKNMFWCWTLDTEITWFIALSQKPTYLQHPFPKPNSSVLNVLLFPWCEHKNLVILDQTKDHSSSVSCPQDSWK